MCVGLPAFLQHMMLSQVIRNSDKHSESCSEGERDV